MTGYGIRCRDDMVGDYVKITVNDTDLCPHFIPQRVITDIKIGDSPILDYGGRLITAGIRPISNASGYNQLAMLEYGNLCTPLTFDQKLKRRDHSTAGN